LSIVALLISLAGIVLTAAAVYLVFWAFVYLANRAEPGFLPAPPRLRFAVIVPAHDEEEGIAHTLENIKSVDYPQSLFEIVVVADNCSDGTSSVAQSCGVRSLERDDPELRGKGYALQFAFSRLLKESFDAFIVVDADSVLDADFLRVMNDRLLRGEKVVQACYGMSNPDVNPMTYMMQVGNVMENFLFYAAKARLGLPAVLRGNGMCFAREVLEENPWDSFSVVEDTEYTLRLVREGIAIPFAAETRVLARQPETIDQAHTQRVRWASGNLKLTRVHALSLISEGARRGSGTLIDLGVSFLVLSKPLLLLASLLLASATIVVGALAPLNPIAWGLGIFPAALLMIYMAIGIVSAGISPRRFAYLLCTPWYLGWFFLVSLLGVAGYRANLWLRTGRT
jgi:1,2-diacylglycerol 3-beta-glucosyltransferase